jgi:hypothetical protein
MLMSWQPLPHPNPPPPEGRGLIGTFAITSIYSGLEFSESA